VPNLTSQTLAPGTTLVTTAETLAANIPAGPLQLPGGSPVQIIIRGMIYVTTGSAAGGLAARLRLGQNNTTTNLIGNAATVPCGASGLFVVPFTFIDTLPADYTGSGYSLTVVQTGASGNGTITQVVYEVATTP
jgi:hypothetical protein